MARACTTAESCTHDERTCAQRDEIFEECDGFLPW